MAKKRKLPQPSTPGSNKKRPQQQGGGKPHSKAKKPQKQQQYQAPPAADDDAEQPGSEELEVSEEDVAFVQQFGQQLGFLTQLKPQELDKAAKAKQQQKAPAATAAAAAAAGAGGEGSDAAGSDEDPGDDSDAEAADYERRPRAAEQQQKGPSTQGLPVKTAAGEVVFAPNKQQQQRLLAGSRVQVAGVTVEDDLLLQEQQQETKGGKKGRESAGRQAEQQEGEEGSEEEEDAAAAARERKALQQATKAASEQSDLPPALLSLLSIADQARRREALKQQMALAAQHLLAEPDKHIGPGLKLLSACASDGDGVVVRLALLSLLAVFKDLLPGYRIRPVAEEEAQVRVSKEVEALRSFEASLLRGYQAYLKTLLAAAGPAAAAAAKGGSGSARLATSRVAVRCMGQLLVAKPGFNYSSDLLQAVVPHMVSPDRETAQLAIAALRQLLQEDIQGKTSLEAVQLVADLVRKRRCVVDPAVVSVLLVLRFEAVTPTQQGGEGVGRQAGPKGGKKGRKRGRNKSDLERDLEEAEAGPDAREQALLQSQMLEALFETFFRVLKHCSAATAAASSNPLADPAADTGSGPAAESLDSSSSKGGVLVQPWAAAKVHRKFPLLQPTLSGLGRYSHLISVDYFNDLMAVLQELLATGALPVRERLCVLLAALDILRGQGEALTIDRRAFYNQLYGTLQLVPLAVLYEGLAAGSSSSSSGGGGGGGGSNARQQGSGAAAAAGGEEDSEQEVLLEAQRALDAVRISQLGWEAAAPGSSSGRSSAPTQQQQQLPTAVLLLRCLEQQLLGVKQSDMARLAAFVKRLAGLMLSASVGEALGAACLLWRLAKRYPKLLCLLEWEGGAPVGGMQYTPGCEDPSEAGAMAAALWELPLLARHYHPHAAAAAKLLLGLTPGSSRAQGEEEEGGGGGRGPGGLSGAGAVAGVIAGALGPQQVAASYEAVRQGGFRPAPQVPPGLAGGKGGARGPAGGSSKAQLAARAAAAAGPLTPDLLQAVQQEGEGGAAVLGAGEQQQAQQQGRKKQKQQKHQQQQQGSNGVVPGSNPQQLQAVLEGGADMAAVQAAVRQHYRLSREHVVNQQLRREAALTAHKVQLFREHLIRRHQQQQQQQQQQQGPAGHGPPRKALGVAKGGVVKHHTSKQQQQQQQHRKHSRNNQ